MTKEQILNSLGTVKDPELHKDLVSLGFIENIKIDGNNAAFTVMLTTPACPLKDKIRMDCMEALRRDIPDIGKIELTFSSRIRHDSRLADSKNFPFKNVIAVGAGKGGVGKTTVAVNLAVSLAKSGANVGLLDADIYGPNIPSMLGIDESPRQDGQMILPIEKHGIKLMSMGFLISAEQALVWRGPMIHSAINQLLSQVMWGDLDYLVVDLPPGTGDAQMSLAQQIPLTGAVVVTTPQRVSVSDSLRAVDAFRKLNVPVLGIVENMAGTVFGSGSGEDAADSLGLRFLGRLPLEAAVAAAGESGTPYLLGQELSPSMDALREIAGNTAAAVSMVTVQ